MAHFCSPDVRNSTFLFYPHFKGRPKYPTLLLFCLKWPESYIQPLSKFCRIMKRHIINLAHYITTLYNVAFQFLKIHCIRIFCIWNNPSMFWTWRLMQICCFHLTIYIIWWLCEFFFLACVLGAGRCSNICGTAGGDQTSGKLPRMSHNVWCSSPALYKDNSPLISLMIAIYSLHFDIHQCTFSWTSWLVVWMAFS